MIVVGGSTGQVGRAVVNTLVAQGLPVRALVEPGLPHPYVQGTGVEVATADFGDARTMQSMLAGADSYFMMSPPHTEQERWQRIQVEAARTAGVSRVVKLSAFDTGPESRTTMGRWHWDGEVALRAAGLPHAVLRPQYFMENLLHDEAGLRAGMLTTFIAADRPVGMVAATDVGAVAASLLVQEELVGQVVVPTGPAAITTGDVARAVEHVIGRPVTTRYVHGEHAVAALLSTGRPDWHAADVIEMCTSASPLITDDVARATGRPATAIDAVVAARLGVASAVTG